MSPSALAIFGLPGGTEWVVIGVIALLLFGRRLPEVARSFGKSIVEFKRGLKDVKDEIGDQDEPDSPRQRKLDRQQQAPTTGSVASPAEREKAGSESVPRESTAPSSPTSK